MVPFYAYTSKLNPPTANTLPSPEIGYIIDPPPEPVTLNMILPLLVSTRVARLSCVTRAIGAVVGQSYPVHPKRIRPR